MSWIKKILGLQPKLTKFPKNTSWLLNDDLSVNVKNIRHCREFAVLKNIKQTPKYHAEGNAWNHTLLVAKEMHNIINNQLSGISPRDKRILMIAAACHDLGKATTTYWDTKENDWKCKNHGAVGERITRELLYDETDKWMREEICWLVRWHMDFHHFTEKNNNEKYSKLTALSQGNSSIEKLLWLNVADSLGSHSKENTRGSIMARFDEIKEMAETYNCYRKPYQAFKNKSTFNMYVMIGVPGSGKDTYIQKFLPNLDTVCRDDIREELAYGEIRGNKLLLDKTKEAMVTDIVNKRIQKLCTEKKSFIVNQTNMKKKYRTLLKETAFKYGIPNIIYIYVEAPSIDECKERRGHGKWDGIIDRMWNEFEFPDRNECNELIFYKQ